MDRRSVLNNLADNITDDELIYLISRTRNKRMTTLVDNLYQTARQYETDTTRHVPRPFTNRVGG